MRIKSIQPKVSATKITAKGNLTLAGVTNFIEMEIMVVGNGKFAFECSNALKMAEYGAFSPKAILGAVHACNEITIHIVTNFSGNN